MAAIGQMGRSPFSYYTRRHSNSRTGNPLGTHLLINNSSIEIQTIPYCYINQKLIILLSSLKTISPIRSNARSGERMNFLLRTILFLTLLSANHMWSIGLCNMTWSSYSLTTSDYVFLLSPKYNTAKIASLHTQMRSWLLFEIAIRRWRCALCWIGMDMLD
jgi:hypothetical protein